MNITHERPLLKDRPAQAEEEKGLPQNLLAKRQKDNLRERFRNKFGNNYETFFEFFGVDTKGKAGKAMVCCIFHADNSPSMSIQFHEGLFNCFGCGAQGDALDFAARVYRMDTHRDFQELLMKLKEDFSL